MHHRKKAGSILSFNSERLVTAEIRAQKQAAAIFRKVLREDLIDKRRPIPGQLPSDRFAVGFFWHYDHRFDCWT
jgi:hypothetical protein